jgi:hypothetical protein
MISCSKRGSVVKILELILCKILNNIVQTLTLKHLPIRTRIGKEHDRWDSHVESALNIWFRNVR